MTKNITDMRSLHCNLHHRYTPQDCPFSVSSKNDEVLLIHGAGHGFTVAGLEVKKQLDAKVGLWPSSGVIAKNPNETCHLLCVFLALFALPAHFRMVTAKREGQLTSPFP